MNEVKAFIRKRKAEEVIDNLEDWKIADWQVDEIITSGEPSEELDIYSHKEGYVLKRHASVGNYLEEGELMFEISSLDNLWVIFDAYESSLGELKKGDVIRFTLDAVPGKTFESQIDFIDPTLNNETRTVAIRSDILNPDADLKPGMLAIGIIKSPLSGPEQLLVPKSAVMWTGRRSIVYVKVPNANIPTFEAREVVLGKRAGDFYIIETGLSEGEEVVTNGTFKIDSAAQIADKLSMMNREPGSGAVPVHDHGEMETGDSGENKTEENHSNH